MKILFETYSGKKVTKNFESLKETKKFVQRNKAFIKEAQIVDSKEALRGLFKQINRAHVDLIDGLDFLESVKGINSQLKKDYYHCIEILDRMRNAH